ncbi:MAG: ABC transporter ATP-binding protein [Lentimicrobiaceae bacterium]|nr:ABC transporter ATP-binding protein [Lentimicrobiaceae bacterium]
MIEIANISKKFGSFQALENINMTIRKGTVVGVVGENGSGKTTLFRCIAGLEDYEGKIISEIKPLKNHLGFLPTEPYFFSKITAKEYIRLLCNARGKNASDIEEKNIFDLPLDKYVSTFSTGMKKKLAFAAILFQENACLILDEPFNGIDIQTSFIVSEIILRLKSLQKTLIVASHIFSTLSDVCDEIHLLRQGKLVKSFQKEQFTDLETEMKTFSIQNKIDKLGLR